AWALLANAHALFPLYASTVYVSADLMRQARDANFPKVEAAARKAIALDANNPEAWSALGQVLAQRQTFIQAEDAYKRALQFAPKNVSALHSYAHDLSGTGHVKEALEMRRQTVALDPLDARLQMNLAHVLGMNGRYDAALEIKSLNLANL